ncbi:MAG: hypothetical protein QOE70_5110 [Chthoniobacter sp.]|jgi:hypothetical protein|nr:hypothetical protein [Chthoniobacter sp.]
MPRALDLLALSAITSLYFNGWAGTDAQTTEIAAPADRAEAFALSPDGTRVTAGSRGESGTGEWWLSAW